VSMPLRMPALAMFAAALLCAQEKTAVKEPEKELEKEAEPRVEAEFVASDVFRSGSTVITIWRGLRLEGEYFGAPPMT
jgi:hypothetical protein